MDKYIVEKSKDNYDILKIVNDKRSIYIGSKYNEKREIDKFINLAGEMTEKDNYVVLGLGTGKRYHDHFSRYNMPLDRAGKLQAKGWCIRASYQHH